MSKNIQNVVNSIGWQEIKAIFNNCIEQCKDEHIDEKMNATEYKTNSLANRKAAAYLKKLLKDVELKGQKQAIKKDIKYV